MNKCSCANKSGVLLQGGRDDRSLPAGGIKGVSSDVVLHGLEERFADLGDTAANNYFLRIKGID
ncbi:hypothetical protein D3C72_2099220 [compost metagenome]